MNTRYRRPRLSEAEREERRRAERERVKEAAEQLLTSEGWQRWVHARSMLRRYSAHNCMLIALDFHLRGIEAEPVAGFRTWLKLGRCVRKGEHGIRIAARVTAKKADPGAPAPEREQTDERDRRPMRFTTVAVFDRLSRVRQGMSSMSGREIRYRSVSRLLLLVRAPGPAGGDGLWFARSSRSRRPEGDGGVPGTDVEIGGVSPVLEPDRGNPTSKARARPGIDRAVPSAAWLCAAGVSVRAGLKEALDALWSRTKVKRRKAFLGWASWPLAAMPDSCRWSRGRSGDVITTKSQRFTPGDLLGSGRGRPVGRRT